MINMDLKLIRVPFCEKQWNEITIGKEKELDVYLYANPIYHSS